ncbi:MAG: hypothetical protein AAB263_13505 [Planctomycetota bacterium]
MQYALEALADGKQLRIDPAQPLSLKVKRHNQPGGEILVGLKDGKLYLDNRSTATCMVNDVQKAAAALAQGDRLQLGTSAFMVVAIQAVTDVEVVEPRTGSGEPAKRAQPTPPPVPMTAMYRTPAGGTKVPTPTPAAKPSSDSDQLRNQRRISASRLTAVEPTSTQSSGLLKRMSAAFTGRNERQRLEQLEQERRAALIESGRRSLGDGGGFGLPPDAMSKLQNDEAVILTQADLAGLSQWRTDRQRLVRLDAEIAALRQALFLGPDPDAVLLTTPTLRSDERVKTDRAFATMDEIGTQELSGMVDSGKPQKGTKGK